jgi:hypothetical protein
MTQQTLNTLQTAKTHSDKKEYPQKAKLMYKLMREHPEEFSVDASEKGHPGVTHNPTGFRMHVPWAYVPANVGAQVKSTKEASDFSDGSLWKDVNHEPTEAQQEAGNYKKGHIRMHGLMISIENPKGSTRTGVNSDGKRWENVMAHHYGYIRGSQGADSDQVDVYVGPDTSSEKVWVIDQVNPKTGEFDEAKVMLGFNSIGEATKGYFDCYNKGWKGLGEITECSVSELKDWIADGCDPDEFYSWSKQGETKAASISYVDGKYLVQGESYDTRVEAIAAEYSMRKQATEDWTPSEELKKLWWDLEENSGKGMTPDKFKPYPTAGWVSKPAFKAVGDINSMEIDGGVTGDWTAGQQYGYDDWNKSITQRLIDARKAVMSVHGQDTVNAWPQGGQWGHIIHAANTGYKKKTDAAGNVISDNTWPMYAKALTDRNAEQVQKHFGLAPKAGWAGLEYRNAMLKKRLVDPMIAKWNTPAPTATPQPATSGDLAPQSTPMSSPNATSATPQTLQKMDSSTIDITNQPDTWKQTLGPDGKMITEYFQKKSTQAPLTLQQALKGIDLLALEAQQRDILKKGPKSKRHKAIQTLGVIEGLKRNEVNPDELMINRVPVIPPQFRPFSAQGSTFIPGDANVLYKELIDMRKAYQQERSVFGDEGAGKSRGSLYDAVKAVYGYGDSTNEKSKQKGVSGFMQKILGKGGPKYGWMARKMLGKTQDSVARGVITVNPDLDIDQIDIPKDMAWTMYAPYVQRRLVQAGMSPGDALKNVKDRTQHATRALEREVDDRWVVYSRAPVWHKYGIISGKANLIDGDAIAVNPFVEAGLGSDHDGDQVNVHLPASAEALSEAKTKLRPSAMLFKNRSPDEIMPAPKQEQILGLSTARSRPSRQTHYFPTEEAAVREIKLGRIPLSDDIQIGKPKVPTTPGVPPKPPQLP